MKKGFIALIGVAFSISIYSQGQHKRVLFIGNSYTNVNNLPLLVSNVANSTGDTLVFDSNTPGGYTLQSHVTNSTTLGKIAQANWDFVVLQEQSQRPSFPNAQVQTDVFPYAKKLDSLINNANSCTETVFYMTWGRENGDANNCPFFAPLCTYQGMDSMLNLRYRQMADSNVALVSPVGAVWNFIRTNHPQLNLYSSDGSHPSVMGSYAAACTFYTTILRKDPTNISFNSNLNAADAVLIRSAVKAVVYDSMPKWNIGKFDNKAKFSFNEIWNGHQFESQSPFMSSHLWDFGDGNSSLLDNPFHSYSTGGFYKVTHQVSNCGLVYNDSVNINYLPLDIKKELSNTPVTVSPNPTKGIVNIKAIGKINRVHLFSLKGKEVLSVLINEVSNQIDMTELVPGLYILEIELENGDLKRQKIIKVHF